VRRWQQEHAEYMSEYHRRWQKANPEKVRAQSRRYRERQRARISDALPDAERPELQS
jgi:hypothetical protein